MKFLVVDELLKACTDYLVNGIGLHLSAVHALNEAHRNISLTESLEVSTTSAICKFLLLNLRIICRLDVHSKLDIELVNLVFC